MTHVCPCGCDKWDKGREFDGRRCYRCRQCGAVHSAGLQGAERRYSPQREAQQFHDSSGPGHVGRSGRGAT